MGSGSGLRSSKTRGPCSDTVIGQKTLYVSHSRDANALVWRQPFGFSVKSSGGPRPESLSPALCRDATPEQQQQQQQQQRQL
eukprot:3983897-Amphidinium_carterae.1